MRHAALVPGGMGVMGLDNGVWPADIMVAGGAAVSGPDGTAFEHARITDCDTCSDTIVNILNMSMPVAPGMASVSDSDDPNVIAIDGRIGALACAGAVLVAGRLELPVVMVVVVNAAPASDILISMYVYSTTLLH